MTINWLEYWIVMLTILLGLPVVVFLCVKLGVLGFLNGKKQFEDSNKEKK